MDKIDGFLKHNSKYKGFQKPLEAAGVCDVARKYSKGSYEVISFHDGLLTLGTHSPTQSMELQMQSTKIIDDINIDLGCEKVKKIRYRLI